MAENNIDILVRLKNLFSKEAQAIVKDTQNLSTASKQTSKDFDTMSAKSSNLSKALGALGSAGVFTVITKGLFEIGKNALKAASDWENMQTSFTTLLGSADKANKLLADIKETAATTPFTLTGLADASRTLLSFGIAQEKIIPTMRMLGDVSGGNSEKLKSLSLAYAQVQSTGRLMGQDLLQMINQGFNPLQIISEKTGKSMAQLKKEMEGGGISAAQVAEAFKIATSEGGRFFNGMNDASKTLSGRFSNLQDGIDEFLRGLGEKMLPIAKIFVEAMIKIVETFNRLPDGIKTFILIMVGVSAAIVAAIFGFQALIAVVGALGVTFNVALLGIPLLIGAIVAGVYLLATNFQNLKNIVVDSFNFIKKILLDVAASIAQAYIGVFKMILEGVKRITDVLNKIPGIEINTQGAIDGLDKLSKKLQEGKDQRQKDDEAEKARREKDREDLNKKKEEDAAKDIETAKLKSDLEKDQANQEKMVAEEKAAKEVSDLEKKKEQELGILGAFLLKKGILNQKEAENFAKWQNFMASATTSKNKEVAAIAKGMAIFNIGVQTYQAAMGAFNAMVGIPFVGPALAIGAAAAATAFGVEQANAVASQQPAFAGGGVVGGFNGATMGGDNTQASVRTGEMVLNADQQKNLFDVANSGGGGGQTIQLVVDNIVLAETVVQGYNKGQNIGRVTRLQ